MTGPGATALLGLGLLLALGASAARADAALSISGFFSSRLEATDNDDGDGPYDWINDVGFTLSRRTPVSSLSFSPGVSLRIQEDGFETEDINPRFDFSFNRRGRRLTVNAGAQIRPEFTNSLSQQFGDLSDPTATPGDDVDAPGDGPADGVEVRTVETDESVLNYRANLGASYALDPLNSLNAGLFATRREAIDGDLETTHSVGGSLGLSHLLSPTTSASTSFSARRFFSDGEEDDSTTASASVGLNGPLTSRVRYGVGVGLTTIVEGENAGELGFNGDASLSFAGARGSATIFASQSVTQDDDGALQNTTSFGISGSRPLTRFTTLSASAGGRLDTPFGGNSGDNDSSLFALTRISYTLSADWRASVGYQARRDNDDDRISNIVFIQISRGLSLLR